MCTAKICLNSVPRGPINFILGIRHEDDPQQVGLKMVAMATPVAWHPRLPGNWATKSVVYG